MANTKITLGNIADDAIGLDQLNISNDPSDGQVLSYSATALLTWTDMSVAGISSSADATAITIDSSERVGIGATSPDTLLELSSAVGTGTSLLKLRNSSSAAVNNISQIDFEFDNSFSGVNTDVQIGAIKENAGNEESSFFIKTTDGTGTPTERMRITSAGEVGIGTTPTSGRNLHISSTTQDALKVQVATSVNQIELANSSNSPCYLTQDGYGFQIKADENGWGGSNSFFAVKVKASERFRVNSNGNFMLGTTTNPLTNSEAKINLVTTTGEDGINIKHGQPGYNTINIYQTGSSTFNAIKFYKGATQAAVGQIQCTTSATSYQSGSDYRLKENIIDLTDAIDRVKQLQPKRFNFIADETDELVDGFLAHEAQTVVPEAVSGSHNEVDEDDNPIYQCIDLAKLVPVLTGALQEAIKKIETLEARIETLESN